MHLGKIHGAVILTDRDLVDSLVDIESGLNDWEIDFVEDVAMRVIQYGESMSPNQRSKAEQILGKTSGE